MSQRLQHTWAGLAHDPAPVVWITGLSGTGKSTTARALQAALRAEGLSPLLLDGDEFRAAVSDDLGHSPAERLINAQRLVRFASLASSQGVITIVATMSLLAPIHAEVRTLPRVRVVYLKAPLDVLRDRDPKGLYAEVVAGRRQHVVGMDLTYDPPPNPDLSLESANAADLETNVRHIRSSLTPWLPITPP